MDTQVNLRTPLSEQEKVIINHALMQKVIDILDDPLIPAQQELRDDIIKTTEPLINLVGELFDKSAFTKEQMKLYKEYRKISREVASVLTIARTSKINEQARAITALNSLIKRMNYDIKLEDEERDSMKGTDAIDQFLRMSELADMFYGFGLRIDALPQKKRDSFNKSLFKLMQKYDI